jgi:hypothetical protein
LAPGRSCSALALERVPVVAENAFWEALDAARTPVASDSEIQSLVALR